MHVFGFASKIEELKKIANKYKIKLIEDASEALGSIYKNKALGTFGDIGTISFNGNKIDHNWRWWSNFNKFKKCL